MSKSTKIIAGVSLGALALAAIPAASSFAAITDKTAEVTYKVAIDESMEWKINDAEVTDGKYTVLDDAKLANGAANAAIGTTKFSVVTNNGKGFILSAIDKGDSTALNGAKDTSAAINYSTTAISTATSGVTASSWNLTTNGKSITNGTATDLGILDLKAAGTQDGAATVASNNKATDGQDATVTFAAAMGPAQEADTYTNTVVYTLHANV